MRFKTSQIYSSGCHKNIVTCVAWSSPDDIFSCGDDHLLLNWHIEGSNAQASTITKFQDDFNPTEMQFHPRSLVPAGPSLNRKSCSTLLMTTSDGNFYFVNKNGKIEKKVEAHTGATLTGQWSCDGSALLTAGEDGIIKIWSRSGMLRSTIIRGALPILTASWSLDCTAILFSQGTQLAIQSLNISSKPYMWYAHDGLVLVVSWNRNNGVIVSGGEDCRYKLWDSNGNQLYCSAAVEYPITAVSWSPNGNYFAVGYYNTIKLCDKTGWTYSLEKLNTGSIYSIAWSNDSTQVAVACGNSAVITAHVTDRELEWNNYVASLVQTKTIEVREIGSDRLESLEISDRIVYFEFAFDHLVIVTPIQCHIYSSANWNTPTIFDLNTTSVSAVMLAKKHLLLVEWNTLSMYNYQGRLLSAPEWIGMTQEPLYVPCIGFCSDTLVVRDQSNEKLLHIIDLSNNKPVSQSKQYIHPYNIEEIAINHTGNSKDRIFALMDQNRDLFLIAMQANGSERICKIAAMAQTVAWAMDANVLVAILDTSLSVWLCPNCTHLSDKKVIRKTRVDKETSEYGKQSRIISVQNGMITVRRSDGVVIATPIHAFFMSFHQLITSKKWQKALALCRIAQNNILWTCMAVMATENKQLSAAEEAYAAIERYDKVDDIQKLQVIK